MKPYIPPFEPARVLIAGDVMLDRYWYGPAARISPEAPVPVVKVEEIEERPGGAANVAVNIATLGGRVRVLGVAGADEAATTLETKLRRLGVACELIRQPGQATITKLRVLSRTLRRPSARQRRRGVVRLSKGCAARGRGVDPHRPRRRQARAGGPQGL